MKIVVFGGSGFIGSHVADELSSRGNEVVIFDIKKSEYISGNQKMVVGDILDRESVFNAVNGADIVFNFAGLADLDSASERPADTVRLNILGTVNILDACVKAKVKKIVYSSTIYVYSELGGFYRCSKQAAENYIEEYKKKFGIDFIILRYGTVYGPRADKSNSIYRCLKQAMDNGKIVCPGSGEEVREYVHVKDVARLTVDILADSYKNRYVTITGHHPTKYKDMIHTIKEILHNKIEVEFKPELRNSAHYNITPYSFTPKLGIKLVSDNYIDLGQGLLECIVEMQGESEKDA